MASYRCDTCKRRYDSPVSLSEPPVCSGKAGPFTTPHSPRAMCPIVPTQKGNVNTMTETDKAVKATKTPDKDCQCFAEPGDEAGTYRSCGRLTRGRFAPGHDAKLKGVLIRCAVMGVKYRRVSAEGTVKNLDPLVVAEDNGWKHLVQHGVDVAAAKEARKVDSAAKKAAAKAATPTKKAADKPKAARKAPAKDGAAPKARRPRTPAKA